MTTESKKIRFNAKVISDFRITIPSIERSLLELQEGDFLIVEIQKAQLNKNVKPSEKGVVKA